MYEFLQLLICNKIKLSPTRYHVQVEREHKFLRFMLSVKISKGIEIYNFKCYPQIHRHPMIFIAL